MFAICRARPEHVTEGPIYWANLGSSTAKMGRAGRGGSYSIIVFVLIHKYNDYIFAATSATHMARKGRGFLIALLAFPGVDQRATLSPRPKELVAHIHFCGSKLMAFT